MSLFTKTVVNFRDNRLGAEARRHNRDITIDIYDICHSTKNCIQQGSKSKFSDDPCSIPSIMFKAKNTFQFHVPSKIHSNFTLLQYATDAFQVSYMTR